MADLSGFPILRIDQISIIDSDTLADAQKESKELIANMLAQSPSPIPPMVQYLRKQSDAISNELMNRLAQERINALLSGASTLLNENRSKYISTPDDDEHSQSSLSIKSEKSTHTPVKSTPSPPTLPIPSFQPLPLPSERKKQSIATNITTPMKENTQTSTESTSQYVSPLRRSETSPVGIAMSSRSTTDPPSANRAVDDSSTSTAPSKPRRPLSGDIRPSRRSQEFINKNFGSLFIVAGEGKPRRQLPVKKVVEPVEVVKARERLDRRKAAMERLLARKEERQKQQLAKKETQRAAKRDAERQQATTAASTAAEGGGVVVAGTVKNDSSTMQSDQHENPNDTTSNQAKATDRDTADPGLDPTGDSSGSESVSGGDDDDQGLEIPEEMISAVTHAQEEAVVEANLSGQKHPSRNSNKIHSRNADKSSKGVVSTVKTSKITFSNVKSPLQRTNSTPISATSASPAAAVRSPSKRSISNTTSPTAKLQESPSIGSKTHATTNPTATTKKPSRRQQGTSAITNTLMDSDTDSSLLSQKPRRERTSIRDNPTTSPSDITQNSTKVSNKRKSVYRTENTTTTTTRNTTTMETSKNDENSHLDAITKEELEIKTTAALQSLRSMKLKKEQMKLNSFKKALSSNALATSSSTSNSPRHLVTTEPGDDEVDGTGRSSVGALVVQSGESTLEGASEDRIDYPTERAVTAYDDRESTLEVGIDYPTERAVTAYSDRDVVPISSGDEGQLQSRATRDVNYYIEAEEVEESERLFLKSTAEFAESTTRHVRAAHLQVDGEQPGEQPIHRPNTVPLPPSPTRRYEEGVTTVNDGEFSPIRRKTVFAFPTNWDTSERASIDLSNETLEICEDMDKFTVPVSSRTVADATHPAVSQLLAGHVHSCLLYIQEDIYCCKIGADDLPGLCSWKLASIENECANWVVSIAKYSRVNPLQPSSSAAHAGVFHRRAAMRRSVSLGLLVLLLDTEDILLGKVRLFNAEHFTTLWREYIRLFDEKAEALAVQYGPDVLFTETAVCGNTHAVCKKLENLLKTLFIPSANSIEGRLHRALHAQEELLPPPSPREPFPIANHDTMQQHPDHNHEQGHPTGTRDIGNTGYDSTDQDGGQGGSHNQSDADSDADDCGAGSLDDDDDASIVPIYPASLYNQFLELQEKEQQRLEKESQVEAEGGTDRAALVIVEEKNNDNIDHIQESETSSTKQRSKNKTETNRNVLVKKSSEKSAGSSNTTSVRLTEFYPTLGSIFPAAYSQLSNRPGDDSSGGARVLIESMQVQCKMYAEWIEVMSDYSTVFSDDRRGCAEHHFDKEKEKPDQEHQQEETTGNSTVYKGGTRSLHYRVKSGRSEVNNIVTDVFNNYLTQWEELPAGLGLGLSWNILWTWSKPRIKMTHLLAWQRVNHYPDSKELTRKDLLKKNIQRYTVMGGKTGEQFNIMPMTFLLPHEYTSFVQAFTTAETNKIIDNIQNFWILKPLGMSRGRGISLIKDLSEISYSQSSVVQKYIERPLCLQGYKFDLRLYIVVTSFHPLEAFIYRDGFARVSTHQYSLNPEDTINKFIHLTNSSIQCQNTDGISKDSPLQVTGEEDNDHDTGGSKISLLGNNGLWKRLEENNINIAALWQSICILVLKSLVIVDEKIPNQPCCFELFGYDVLIDADLRPWLLEVNASPSLARTNPLDIRIKNALIRDIIHLINPAPYDRAAVVRILQKRLNSITKNRFIMGKNDPDLEQDLKDILGDFLPRKLGEIPLHMGNFEMLCPGTNEYIQVLKLKKKIIKS